MSNDTWQMMQAFFVLFLVAGAIVAFGVALGRKEVATRISDVRLP